MLVEYGPERGRPGFLVQERERVFRNGDGSRGPKQQ